MNNRDVVLAHFAPADLQASDFNATEWNVAHPVQITKYWSGIEAPAGRHTEARIIWTDHALLVRFNCCQAEPFIISENPVLNTKTIGLWDRDTCEMFVATGQQSPGHYYEFEVSPVGEWLDLQLRLTEEGRETDLVYTSGMTAAAQIISEKEAVIAMRIPWEAFALRPRMGDVWRINLCRCIGT
ncbi:MAG: carbohydrate-binding family 9-like protein, partial [Pyrinomonadaceae bacterium]